MEDHPAEVFSRLLVVVPRLSEGLIDPSLCSTDVSEAEARLSVDGKKVWLLAGGATTTTGNTDSDVVPVRIDGAHEATLVSNGGLSGGFTHHHNDENDCFGPDLDLFPIALDPITGLPTSQFVEVQVQVTYEEREESVDVQYNLAYARRHWGFYEVMVSREELMCVRPGYGLPDLWDTRLEQVPDGAKSPIQLTLAEREVLNRLRGLTGGPILKANFNDPPWDEQEAVSRHLEAGIKAKLHLAATKMGVVDLGLDPRTLLGLHLRRLADGIKKLKSLHGENISKPEDGLPSRPELPFFPRWTARYYLKYQAGYLSPSAIQARNSGYQTDNLPKYIEDELEKLTRWPTPEELTVRNSV
ncbi:hypothetical protein HYALB_00012932 [Hymenoscyphus albidus]|uniref:Uncharacterized protein n=1 Tax=Hymenoscyphus albidus TaxID=595503 RepID=A0A9N9LT34_9HELO|nr:hypothetical protein HYALB_00012932 [Hymenoscyphus albidus]